MRQAISLTKNSSTNMGSGSETMDICLMEMLGQGSFGKVYLVRHVKEGKPYVIKVIKVKGMPLKER